MTAKHRPRRIKEKTQTYNMLFPVDLLHRIHEAAAEREMSSAGFVREAVEAHLQNKPVSFGDAVFPPPSPITTMTYDEGVSDVIDKIREVRRLKVPMATGQTMGDLVAAELERAFWKE